ncbi:hypothetical protein CTI12_AA241780 [Artemisia annua]|uniref:FORKED 1 n=1 Tax=Artemisia annua TaxID=35608 RepID=A0A2U1NPR6_ARTAN|nr:hypothetical protein CTI12_AA241780 [Artemisia annua]
MDCDTMPTLSEAHPETMDLLSRAWCDFAVKEAMQPEFQNQALVLHEYSISSFDDGSTSPNYLKLESIKMDDATKPLPPWKTNDVKQSWHINPFKTSHLSIKKWLKEIKQKKKENERLQKAEVHAAISVAGVAAALAAIAAENSHHSGSNSTNLAKEAAVASAAALVAAHCAKTAEAMGAKKQQISTAMSSAMSATSENHILTLTAAASTSLRGASTLKTRSACKNRLNTNAPVLPIEENTEFEFDFDNCRSILRRGTELRIKTSDGKQISIFRNLFCIVLDQHVELYKNPVNKYETCFLVALTTTRGVIKLDMINDDECYKIWTRTINHMLSLSTSYTKYSLPYHKN